MTEVFYRVQPAERDVAALLDPATWQSSAWEPTSKRCGTCNGTGQHYDRDSDWPEACDACRGHGEVEDVRHGVSACWSLDDLVDYFRGRTNHSQAWIDSLVVVEMEADVADDDDHDHSDGAVLVWPRRIVSVQPVPAVLRAVLAGDDEEM